MHTNFSGKSFLVFLLALVCVKSSMVFSVQWAIIWKKLYFTGFVKTVLNLGPGFDIFLAKRFQYSEIWKGFEMFLKFGFSGSTFNLDVTYQILSWLYFGLISITITFMNMKLYYFWNFSPIVFQMSQSVLFFPKKKINWQ